MDNTIEINDQYGQNKPQGLIMFTYVKNGHWTPKKYMTLRDANSKIYYLRKKKIHYRYGNEAVIWKSVYK